MPRIRTITLAGLVASCALAATSGTTVSADEAKPAPCGDLLAFKDPAGDAVDPTVLGDSPPNLDITGGFFRTDAGGTTANIEVSDLSTTVPPDSTAIVWRMLWTSNDTGYYANAVVFFDGSEVYQYGTITDVGGVTSLSNPMGDVKGKLFAGPKGIVQLEIPADLAKPGTVFGAPNAYAARGRIVPGANRGLNSLQDTAPDSGAGKSYTVAPCVEAAPSPTTPAGATTTPGAEALPVTLVTKSAKAAKKKTKSKTLSLKLKSSEAITKIGAQLLRGKKVVGAGKLASLNGTGTLKLKLKSKLKKGSYTLNLVGNRASGERATAAFKLKAK